MDTQKPIFPPDLLAAARLIKDYCGNIPIGYCLKCVLFFNDASGVHGCMLFEHVPSLWELPDAEEEE